MGQKLAPEAWLTRVWRGAGGPQRATLDPKHCQGVSEVARVV